MGGSVKKVDHYSKISGTALYIDDEPKDGLCYGQVVRSAKARARIRSIRLPELPDGYVSVDWRDVPGLNAVHVVEDDMPIFAQEYVEYRGEPVMLIAGPSKELVGQLCRQVDIEYEELVPVIALESSQVDFYDESFSYGEVERAFKEADDIVEESFDTGYQEHAYLEPQGVTACPENGRMTIRGTMQCPYYIYTALETALGMEKEQIRVIQSTTGGGFGGKEDYPSVVACEAAVAALKLGKPVSLIYDRREDMEFTSKRHPCHVTYKAAIKDGRITGWDIDLYLNAGAYRTLSLVVLQRSIICATGAYKADNVRVRGRARKTNTVPCGAFRGFGDPQVFFAVEMFMNHIAQRLGESSWEFKRRNLVEKGDYTPTRGRHHFEVPLPAMVKQLENISGYCEKRRQYRQQRGRYRRGIGLGLHYHGTGFATTKDLADKVKVRLHKDKAGRVTVLTANTDMGQGLFTAFAKIAGDVLGIPYDQIQVPPPDTDHVPNSGPTVASRSVITVGELVRRAALRLKEQWREGEEQMVEEGFIQPDYIIPYEANRYFGDPYPAYAWGAVAVELAVDTYTGLSNVVGIWGIYDIGKVIDQNIARGQYSPINRSVKSILLFRNQT